MEYEELVIQLGIGDAGGYTVQAFAERLGEARPEPLSLPVEAEEIDRLARAFGEAARDLGAEFADDISMAALATLGDRLFRSLLPGGIRSHYDRCMGGIVGHGDRGLRIKIKMGLGIPAIHKLHAIPWEYLHDEETLGFHALSSGTSIVRHLDLPTPGQRPRIKSPLAILIVACRDSALDLERECQAIEKAWKGQAEIHVQRLFDPTLRALREELLARDYHVLHFMGHGGFDPEAGEGSLAFLSPDGRRAWVSGQRLAEQIRDRSSLRLVFLNACWTARASSLGPYAGVATGLLKAGVPAVLAMQFPIADAAALAFSSAFYNRLARRASLDGAVADGRLAIRAERPSSPEFGTPVLFQRMTSGRLVEDDEENEEHEQREAREAPARLGRAAPKAPTPAGRETSEAPGLLPRSAPILLARPGTSKVVPAVLLAAALVLAPLGIRACTASPSLGAPSAAAQSTHGDGGRPLAALGARRYSLHGGQSVFVGELNVEVAAEFSSTGPGPALTLAVTVPYSSTRHYLLQGAAAIPVPPGAGQLVVLDVGWSRQTVSLDAEPGGPPAGGLAAQCLDGIYSRSRSRGGTCSSHGRVVRWL